MAKRNNIGEGEKHKPRQQRNPKSSDNQPKPRSRDNAPNRSNRDNVDGNSQSYRGRDVNEWSPTLSNDHIFSLYHSSDLPQQQGSADVVSASKKFALPDGKSVDSEFHIYQLDEFSEIQIHPDNPRLRENITEESLGDILPSIRTGGLLIEVIIIILDGKPFILDGLRRFTACMIAKKPLAAWVIDGDLYTITRRDAVYITETATTGKKLSWREEGLRYLSLMADKKLKTVNEPRDLMSYLDKTQGEMRGIYRRIEAAKVHPLLIKIFPDPESIPTKHYAKLTKAQIALTEELEKDTENQVSLDDYIGQFCQHIKETFETDKTEAKDAATKETAEESKHHEEKLLTLSETHASLMTLVEHELKLIKSKKAPKRRRTWSEPEYLYKKNDSTFIRVSRHINGRKLRLDCSQLNAKQLKAIDDLFESTLFESK
ncbi:hypothetical protein [Vibrio mediterranei]|uniref:hypothetical protein n=1 Tax=Vibrio mediterranei TaxID=689 RepID=UPI0040679C44